MARWSGRTGPVPKDDPMFKRGARLVGINGLKPLTKSTEKTTAGEQKTQTTTEPNET